ncbi:MAG: pantoate--beta-alanine ligase [Myxococcota bacterium]
MDIITEPSALRAACGAVRNLRQRVGLVPTMGALHEGHLALIEAARARADQVVVSIFVNPTQFGDGEDLDRYPRPLQADLAACEAAGVRYVFAPSANAMYPRGDETRVRAPATAAHLCGHARPDHFQGVATVVTKLFAIVGDCVAVFGRKDYQQLRVIARVVEDLFLPVEVVGIPTVREPDGLALSSRNRYLGDGDRVRALALRDGLNAAWDAFRDGERGVGRVAEVARGPLSVVDRVDYLTVADAETLQPLATTEEIGSRALLAVAAWVGRARLIDNVVLGEDDRPHRGANP